VAQFSLLMAQRELIKSHLDTRLDSWKSVYFICRRPSLEVHLAQSLFVYWSDQAGAVTRTCLPGTKLKNVEDGPEILKILEFYHSIMMKKKR
jgi:hypothetical protein